MENKLHELKTILAEIVDLQHAAAVLDWEQQTYMPPGGVAARADQLATLRTVAHRLFVSHEVGDLLQGLQNNNASWDYDSDEASLVRFTVRHYERARRIPIHLVASITRATTLAHEAWVKARHEADYSLFKPHLAEILDLKRRQAEHLSPYQHIYDPLLDEHEPDMTAADVQAMFAGIKDNLIELVQAIGERKGSVSDEVLRRNYDIERQRAFGLNVAQQIGYDLKRGRLDEAPHPFCTTFAIDDVRITTRFDPNFMPTALFGTIHETGHAVYEQGIDPALNRTGLDEGASLGIHESQSRLWENLVGRSRPFWQHFYSTLQSSFPDSLGDVDLERYYKAINKCKPSLIRVEADEVTYNLHIIIRFELELALLSGELSLDDLPAAWDSKYETYLGIRPANDAEGVLQDIHWSMGAFGYFPTYSIGNLVSVQFMNEARLALPDLEDQIAQGKFDGLLDWLRTNIYRHGSKFTPKELVQRVTGGPMDSGAYTNYLHDKFSEVYEL